MREQIKRGDPRFEPKLQEIRNRFSGRGGGPDSESAINAHKQDIKEGFVYFWSDNSDIATLIKRSAAYILEVMDCDETVRFKVDRQGFRSCCHAFKLSKD